MMANIKIHSLLIFVVLAAEPETVRGGESQQPGNYLASEIIALALIIYFFSRFGCNLQYRSSGFDLA